MNLDQKLLDRLQASADRSEIQNLLGIYCRAIDRLDLDLLKTVYHRDAIDDHGAICANAHEFAEQIIATLRQICTYSMHTVTHAVIDVYGEKAVSEAYYLGYHLVDGRNEAVEKFFGPTYLAAQNAAGKLSSQHAYICGGRYLDELHKRDGAWRIFRRKITNEFSICQAEETTAEGMPGAFHVPSRRDRDDPLYALLRLQTAQ